LLPWRRDACERENFRAGHRTEPDLPALSNTPAPLSPTQTYPHPEVEGELRRWLAVNPRADAAAGFRAGWARLARFVRPKLREWEARWFRAMRENDRLKARVGSLVREVSRLSERG
jgi:hypothetical protein